MISKAKDQLEAKTLKMILLEKPSKFNAFDLMRSYQKMFDERWDYHEFSSLLDQWNGQDVVSVVGHNSDGMTIYALR